MKWWKKKKDIDYTDLVEEPKPTPKPKPEPTIKFDRRDRSNVVSFYETYLQHIRNFPTDISVRKHGGKYAILVGEEGEKVRSNFDGNVPFVPKEGLSAILDMAEKVKVRDFRVDQPIALFPMPGEIGLRLLEITDFVPGDFAITEEEEKDDWNYDYPESGEYVYIARKYLGEKQLLPGTYHVYHPHAIMVCGFQQFEKRNPVREINLWLSGIRLNFRIADAIYRNPLNVFWCQPFILSPQSSMYGSVVTNQGKSDLRPIGAAMYVKE